MRHGPPLPTLVRRLLELIIPPRDLRTLLSEMQESWELRRAREGVDAADAWLRREGRRAVFHAMAERVVRPPRPGTPGLVRDVRHATRRLRRAPAFTVSVVATLALGIAGSTAVFALIHGVLLQPLPYPEPEELVQIYTRIPDQSWGFSMADADALVEHQTTFEGLAFLWRGTATLDTPDGAERITLRQVTPSVFSLLGIEPVLGRGFTEEDVAPGAEPVTVVSWDFWQTRLGGDPSDLGETVRLNGAPVTVVGVLPRRIDPLTDGYEVLRPLRVRTPSRKGPFGMLALGRVHPQARNAAEEELAAIEDRIFPLWESSWPRPEATWAMRDLEEQVVGDVGRVLWVAFTAVGFLLLIACANVANLLVARVLSRRRELSVRRALGASRARLLRHLLVESVVLATVGAGAALGLVFLGLDVVTTYGEDFIPRIHEVALTDPVLLFFGGVTVGAMLLFGVAPTLQAIRGRPSLDMGSGGRGSSPDVGVQRLRRALVAAQFAVTAPLLVGAGLLIATLDELRRVDPGFDPERTLSAQLILPPDRFTSPDTAEMRLAWEGMTERIRALPEVEAAGLGTGRPPDRPAFGNNFVLEDRPVGPGEAQPATPWVIADPSYFEALGIDVVEGRMFDGERDPPRVLLVDRRWASRFYPGRSPVGRRLRHGGCTTPSCPAWTVMGVVDDVRYTGLDDPGDGTVYMNFQRWAGSTSMLVVRTAVARPRAVLPAIRRAIREAEPGVAIADEATGEELLAATLQQPRYLGVLVATFAGIALLLALVGVYGTMAYFVQQQRKGIGIRLALGDDAASVARLVLGRGIRLAVIGTSIGLLTGLTISGYMEGLLFGVRPRDPSTFAAVAALMVGVAAGACWGPALRAARTDPAGMLREE